MSKLMTKSELIEKITDAHEGLTKKDVKGVWARWRRLATKN